MIDKKDDVSFNRNYIQINDSIKLEYFIFEPKKYLKSGIFFLGNGSNILYTYKKLEELSVETKSKVYVLNYRGYGKSEGTPSFKTVFEDNSSFLEFIKCTGNNIDFVIGYSLGSLSATYLATDNKINNLILLAPFSNTDDMFTFIKNKNTKGFKSIARPFVKFSAEDYLLNLSSTEKISMYNGRLVISHAVDDESLPFEMSKKLYYNCPSQQKELIEIDKRGHNAPFMNRYWEELISKLK